MADLTKRKGGKQDLQGWDGTESYTFTATNDDGRTMTMFDVDWPGVDVHTIYGAKTRTALNTACAAIGTSVLARIYLAPGAWDIDDDLDLSSYTNLDFDVPAGATFSVSPGKTLTIPGSIKAGAYKIFTLEVDGDAILADGAVSVSDGRGAEFWAEWWGADVSATGAVNAAAMTAAMAAIPSTGGTVRLTPGAYTSAQFEFAKNRTNLHLPGVTFTASASTITSVILLDGWDWCTIQGPVFFNGPSSENRSAIRVQGTSNGAVKFLRIRDVYTLGAWCAIHVYTDAAMTSWHISRIFAQACGRGIWIQLPAGGTFFDTSILDNIHAWITLENTADDAAGIYVETMIDCIVDQVAIATYNADNHADAILLYPQSTPSANAMIRGNRISRVSLEVGDQGTTPNIDNRHVIKCITSSGYEVFANEFSELKYARKNADCTGGRCINTSGDYFYQNKISGCYSNYVASGSEAIKITGYDNTIDLQGIDQSAITSWIRDHAINTVIIGNKNNPMMYMDTEAASVATSNGTEETLSSCKVQAGQMGTNGMVEIGAHCEITGANGAKLLRVMFGTETVALDEPAAGDNGDYWLKARVWNTTAANTQTYYGRIMEDLAIVYQAKGTGTEDTTADVTVRLRGARNNAGDAVTCDLFYVKFYPTPVPAD